MATSYNYKGVLNLTKAIDEKFSYLITKAKEESDKRLPIENKLQQAQSYIESLNRAIYTLSNSPKNINSSQMVEAEIDKHWEEIQNANSVEVYIAEADKLAALYYGAHNNITSQEKFLEDLKALIDHIKKHPHYETWTTTSEKLNLAIIPDTMPDSLNDYSEKAIDLLIAYSAEKFLKPYERYMFYHLYIVYKRAVMVVQAGETLIPKWIKAMREECQHQENIEIPRINEELSEFDRLSAQSMYQYICKAFGQIEESFSSAKANNIIADIKQKNYDWKTISSQEEICQISKEEYVLTSYSGTTKISLDTNEYVMQLAQKLEEAYSFFKIKKNFLCFTYPLLMNLDTLQFKMVFDASAVTEQTKKSVYGFIRSMVAATIANLPAGKVNFFFVDPNNTGIFTNFRNVGRNEMTGSSFCSCSVDANDIQSELKKLNAQIQYTIQQVLPGIDTTLFKHNQKNSFNISPYVFLFIINYPQNMTKDSLKLLNNIILNGPRCGVFTFIFKMDGLTLESVDSETRQLANNIVQTDFTMKNGGFLDNFHSVLPFENLISTERFNHFLAFYNMTARENKQPVISLDKLSEEVCTDDKFRVQDGEFRIPIGKNLGGGIEYMSFFDACQDYLMSGAPGIGKTNALHVIIYHTIKYIPNAELYLIDFKQGVGFAPYARLNHPAIKALAVESVPEFGYAVLKHIVKKMDAIGELFLSNGVTNWQEYKYAVSDKLYSIMKEQGLSRQKLADMSGIPETIINMACKSNSRINIESAKKIASVLGMPETAVFEIHDGIPVTLIIIDEFTRLFNREIGDERSKLGEECSKLIERIVTEGGAYNIHLILTTQSIDSVTGLTVNTRNNIFGRMVFHHSTAEYRFMLGDDTRLAETLNSNVKGQMVLATGSNDTQRLLQWAKAKPIDEVISELGRSPAVEGIPAKLLLSNVQYHPFSVFNGIINGKYSVNNTDVCEIVFGDEVDNFPEEVQKLSMESSFLKLTASQNILFIGSDESVIEGSFQLSVYSVLARQIARGKEHSIVLVATKYAQKLAAIASEFSMYIDYYKQDNELSNIQLSEKEFFFVFGLQNFRTLHFSRNGFGNHGQMFRTAVESDLVHVIAWHESMSGLESLFNISENNFLCKFYHKIGFHMNEQDSENFINSNSCANLSQLAALYVADNQKSIIRPYKAMDDSYCKKLNEAMRTLHRDNLD